MALLLLFRTEVNNSGITAKPPLVLSHHHMVIAVPFFARWMFPCVLTNVLVKPCVHVMVSSFSVHNDNSAFPLSFIFPTPLYSLTSSHLETSSCLSLLPTLVLKSPTSNNVSCTHTLSVVSWRAAKNYSIFSRAAQWVGA